MAATTVGSLLVELGLDSAQFDRGVQKAVGKTQQIAKTFGVTSKEVYAASQRMGVSVGQFGSQVQALQARINPSIQALSRYRQEMSLLREAYRLGAITQQQFVTQSRSAMMAYRQGSTAVVQANGQMRAGMQQLQFQLNDVVTMWAMGMRPMQIFASQAGQVTQAIGMMSNGAKGFGAFMAGPWGMAITSGIIVLSALIPKLFDAKDAMKDATDAAGSLSEAQSLMAQAFDQTTGKVNSLTGALGKNTEAALLNLRVLSLRLKTEAQAQKASFRATTLEGNKLKGVFGTSMDRPTGSGPIARRAGGSSLITSILKDVEGGKLDTNAAFDRIRGLNFSNSTITQDQAFKALQDIVDAQAKEALASDIDTTLRTGQMTGAFEPDSKTTKEPKAPKAPKGKDPAEIQRRYEDDIARLNNEELRAKLDLTTNAQDRADLSMDILNNERDARIAEINANKDFTEEQKKAQIAYIERLYGKPAQAGADGITVENKPGLLALSIRRDLEREEARLANDMLSRQQDTLTAWADIETNSKERAKLEAAALDIHQQIERNLLEQQIASGDVADAEKAQAELASQQEAARRRLVMQNMSPGQRYMFDLNTQAVNINDAIENIKVNGLEALNNELTDAIVNFKSLGDVATSVIRSILAELIRLQIQQAIIRPLAGMLGLGGGAFGVSASFSPSASLVSSASQTISSGLPFFAKGTNFAPGGLAVVGERGPELVNLPRGSQVIPNHELKSLARNDNQRPVVINVSGPMSHKEARTTGRQAAAAYQLEMAKARRYGIDG